MKVMIAMWFIAVTFLIAVSGCAEQKPKGQGSAGQEMDGEAKIRANLAKLDTSDASLAVAQQYCPIEGKNRLGAMGIPFKILVKDESVFLCCKGCQKKALAAPDVTLAQVRKLKEAAAKSPAK